MNRVLCGIMVALVMVAAGSFAWGQGSGTKAPQQAGSGTKVEAAKVSLCGKCGQIKGSDVCCKADAVKCEKCGLAQGSPGCCKLPVAGADAALCTKCGQIKGSDVCCNADAVKCEKCGMAKGSPGCCAMPKAQ